MLQSRVEESGERKVGEGHRLDTKTPPGRDGNLMTEAVAGMEQILYIYKMNTLILLL